MSAGYFLIYDIISSGFKTSLFDTAGALLESAYRALPQKLEGKTAEQPPEAWVQSMKETTAEVLKGRKAAEICAIAFTAMSQVCLCVEENGKPAGPAMTWSDSRAEEVSDPIRDAFSAEEYHTLTGGGDTPNSSIRKLFWIKKTDPARYEKTAKMIQCKDYLAYCLTGKLFTDYTDAASTGAFDINHLTWSEKVLNCLELDPEKMPPLAQSAAVIGQVTEAAAADFGLTEEIPVLIGAGDILCSAVGAGCIHPGDVYFSLGSSSWAARCSDHPTFDPEGIFAAFPHAVSDRYLSFVNYQTAGVVFKWLKNAIFRYDPDGKREVLPYKNVYPYTDMEAQVKQSRPGSNGLLFLPHLLKGDSSHQESFAKGAYIGLDWTHTREDLMRAALEGVTFELRRFLELICAGELPKQITITGIASHEMFWLQMIADVFGIPVRNTELYDTPDSIGAAILAGCAVGIYPDYDQADRFRAIETVFAPDMELHETYTGLYEIWKEAFDGIGGTLKNLEQWKKGGK